MLELEFLFTVPFATFIVGLLIPIFLYWRSTRNYDYWKKRGVPYPEPIPFIGSHPPHRKSQEIVEEERYKRFGRIYGLFQANTPMISVAEPELLRGILVKDFQSFIDRRVFVTGDPIIDRMMQILGGEDWKRIRSIVSPAFSTGKMKRMMSIFQDCAKSLVQNFKMADAKRDPVDVLKYYTAFTMDIIASSAFSTKLNSHNDPENEFVKRARDTVGRSKFNIRVFLFFIMPRVLRMLGIKVFSPEKMNFFKRVILGIIEERKKVRQTRNDFLQLLLDTAQEVVNEEKSNELEDITANYGEGPINDSILKITTSKHLSMDELVAQCVIFFLAGYHTTATTLGMTTYLLALNQGAQEKVYNEIKEVLRDTNGELQYESVQRMKYLDNVISETLRMYSPGIRLERTAGEDYKLGNTGITIPKGMIVSIPIFAMHRDPLLFPEPERFNPDRFSPQEREKRIPYSYLPFGAGPRNCVGMRFALLEIKVCLVYVFSAFHAKTCSETKIPAEFERSTGLIEPKPIMLRLEPRSDCPLKP